jgi:hypothetical protein
MYGDDDDDDDRLLLLLLEDVSDWMAADAAALYLTSEDEEEEDDDPPPLLMLDNILSIAIDEVNRFLVFKLRLAGFFDSGSLSLLPELMTALRMRRDVVVRSGKFFNINEADTFEEMSHRCESLPLVASAAVWPRENSNTQPIVHLEWRLLLRLPSNIS